MKQEITLESLYNLLSGVITKQEAFNSKMLEFKDNQESFNSHLEDRLDSIQEEERQNHNVTHRMIMQAFGHISDIKGELIDQKEPWMRHKK